MDDAQGQCDDPGVDDGGEVSADPSAELVSKRRLGAKTPAASTHFPKNRLVDKAEQKRLKAVEREAEAKRRRLDKNASTRVALAFQRQPELATVAVQEADGGETQGQLDMLQPGPGHFDVDNMRAPHPTHVLRRMASHPITFCGTCGHWARLNQHSLLTERCMPINRGYKHTLRLLQHDVVPGTGAKIPMAAKQKHGRKRA